MNAPTPAAFAPGVFVAGSIVSAISSSSATSPSANRFADERCGTAHPASQALWPISLAPPSNALTRRIASRRVSRSCLKAVFVTCFSVRSKVAPRQLADGIVDRARRQRHVRQRRVHARRRHHARAVGHEHVRRVPALVPAIEHRRARIVAHAGRAHLVNALAHRIAAVVRGHTADTGRFEQLGEIVLHVLSHEALVLAGLAVDREHGQAPLVLLFRIERDLVAVPREDLAERRGADLPFAGLGGAVLECAADTELAHRALPAAPARAALVAEAAHVLAPLAADISVTRDVEARRPIAAVVLAVQLLVDQEAFGAGAEMVIHEVVTELARAAAQAL